MSQPTTKTSITESFTIVEKSRDSDMSTSTGSYETVDQALAAIRENPSLFGKFGDVTIVQSTVTTVVTTTKKALLSVTIPAR